MRKFLTSKEFNRVDGVGIAFIASALTTHDWGLAVAGVIVSTIVSTLLERKQ